MSGPTRSVEIERKFEVGAAAKRPDFRSVVCASGVTTPEVFLLDAVYFDTSDFVLSANRITLRRRTGGPDEGWHVKLPAEYGRMELHWPVELVCDSSGVPAEVRTAIAAIVGNVRLGAVARIRTRRTVRSVLRSGRRRRGGAAGKGARSDDRVLLEFADDEVRTINFRTLDARRWREWEIELGPAAPTAPAWQSRILNQAQTRLEVAGATLSPRASKLGTVLDAAGPPALGGVVAAALARLTDELAAAIPEAIADKPDAVHQARVRVRKLRSILGVYAPVLRRATERRLRERLRWLGLVLADARDLEVLAGRAESELLASADAATRQRVVAQIRADHAIAHTELCRVLRSRDTAKLLRDATEFALDPKTKGLAVAPAASLAPRIVGPLADRVSTGIATALRDISTVDPEMLHAVRKRARRLRYAVDEVLNVVDGDVRTAMVQLEAAGHEVQDVIGEYRDDVIFAQRADQGIHPEILANVSPTQLSEFAASARVRSEATIERLPATLATLDAARVSLAAALFARRG